MTRPATAGGEFWIVTVFEFTGVPVAEPSEGVTVNLHVCPLASREGGTVVALSSAVSSTLFRNHLTVEPDCTSPSGSEYV
jgi:hypothetical protein